MDSIDWRHFLSGRSPRDDIFDSFPPERMGDYQPALLPSAQMVIAARVGARLLQILSQRGGTRVDATTLENMMEVLGESMPDGAEPLCDDEVARILNWLETAEPLPPEEREQDTLPPALDLMLAADIESRVSVAQFAISEGVDLEMEYYDPDNNTWPRVRCTPTSIRDAVDEDMAVRTEPEEVDEGADRSTLIEGVSEPVLVVERGDDSFGIPLKNIRWLMPVRPRPEPEEAEPDSDESDTGRLLDFPTGRARQNDNNDSDDTVDSNADGEPDDRD